MSFMRRILPLLLIACLVMAMLPAAALAADTGKAIQLVSGGSAANIGGSQKDNVFFGNYFQSNRTTKDPVKWRVLSNAGGQLFLLSDQNLDALQYHTEQEDVTWETSTIRSWLNGYDASANTGGSNGIDYTGDNFLDTAFSAKEQTAIAETNVVNDDNDETGADIPIDAGDDTTDRIFLLSLTETYNKKYFPNYCFSTNTAYVADGGKFGYSMYGVGESDWWWLRSPGSDQSRAAFIEWEDGTSVTDGNPVNNESTAVRPAFNLNLSSVLFTSAAAGGKSAGANGLAAVADYSGSDWKLTLLDSSRTFAVSNAMLGGNTVTFSYSGAQTGVNEYLSAVIMDQNGTIAYYGRILQPSSASGTASLTLPSGVTLSDTTKLYVFNEQYNGDKRTDYASALCQVTPETLQAPSVIITALPGGKVGEAYSRTLAARGSVPITWSIESGSLPAGLTLSGNTISGTPTAAGTFTFTVKASNAAGSDSRELSIVIASVPVDPDPDKQPPVIIAPTTDEKITAEAGGTVTLGVLARNARFYQWYVNDGSGFKAIPGATDADCTLSDLTAQHDGYRYYCVVTNAYGTVTSPVFTLDIPSTPVPATPPKTGDSMPLALCALLALLSLAALTALAARRRRHG